MDFFEAQARAKKRTSRLVLLFAAAVLGIIVVGYVATLILLGRFDGAEPAHATNVESVGFESGYGWWDPRLFTGIFVGTLIVVGVASLYKWMQLRAGGRAVAEMVGAREVSLQTTAPRERQLLNIVEEMAIASGLPLPAVYVLDDETSINAFAAGLTTSDAVIAVTQGTLEKLNRDELQAVVAHEFSHILNGDMRLNTRLTAVLFGILAIGLMGRGILNSLRFSRPRRNSKEGSGVAFIVAIGLLLLVLGYVGYFFGRLIQAAVSRQREFLADASAVQFTRNPAGITGALKKIGGYALGSNIQSNKASELGHFFFAQGFRSMFGGLWATHPPLAERIRAVDASFDGKYFEPPQIVDVATQTWKRQPAANASATGKPPPLPARAAVDPSVLVASIGVLEAAQVLSSQNLLGAIPEPLRDAAHSPNGAGAIACGLLLDTAPAVRTRQLELIRQHAGDAVADELRALEPSLKNLPREARLPLLLLLPPALRNMPRAELDRVLSALDEVVHADSQVSTFEFVLQKVLSHHLDLAAAPAGRREQYSPADVATEIAVTLSFASRLGASDNAEIAGAFAAGAKVFAGLHPALALRESSLDELDAALDKLALAYGPVKKRLLSALAATMANDGRVDPDEAEFLRAVASTLDCPMPPAI